METINSFTKLIFSIPGFIEGFLDQQPKVIMQTKCIKFAFDFLGDALSNVVLTICCVILLSYLRQAVPKLKVNPRFIGLLTFPAFCGLLQRFAAKLERPAGLPHFEGTLLSLAIHLCQPSDYNSEQIEKFNKLMEQLNINLTYSNWLTQNGLSFCMTIIFSALAFFSICTAALGIMGVRKKKHAVPMIGFIIVCIIIRFCLQKPYEAFMDFIVDDVLKVKTEPVTVLAYNLFIYGSIMLIAMIIYMCRTMQTKDKFKKVLPHILYLIGFILFYTVFNICANTSKLEYPIILLFSFILTFAFMIFFLIYGMKKPYKLIQEDVERQNQEDERIEDVKSYKRGNKEIDKFNHDLPNNLTMIEETAANENAPNTTELVHSLLENLLKARKGFVSGNNFLDTVLYRENEKAKAAGIEIIYDGIFPEKGIEIFDISTIFSNALDNAIEACREVEKPIMGVELNSKIQGDYVYFNIINPYKRIRTDKNNNLVTTKADSSSHGIGLKSIEDTVKKYDGSVRIKHENNIFTLEIKMKHQSSEA